MRSTPRFAIHKVRSCRFASLAALASVLLAAGSARADEPAPAPSGTAATPPPADAAPAAAPATPAPAALPPVAPPPIAAPAPVAPAPSQLSTSSSTPSDAPADAPAREGDTRRAEGIRLGLELGFARAFDGAVDRLNAGSPTLLPIGADVSFRTSPSLLLGFHGYAALASRDDCISVDSCKARAYGFGGHIESPLGKGTSLIPYIRYGVGYEMLYHGGAPLDSGGHVYRSAFDFLDLRLGADFVATRGSAGKTGRIGGYAGLVGGVLTGQSGVSHTNSGFGSSARSLDTSSGSAHLWFAMGIRGTLDP
ncbi:MAG: hypothetical protein QOI41_6057 [Myxococcales bacterium]|nr:hypothetical protein [Myxococcales bacterium]